MTNTKFRKRALLSAVAMLLVALVALGSATFAWFTENPVVSASGINAKGQTSIGLKIQTTTDPGYKNTSADLMKSGSFNAGKTAILTPAYAAQAASDNAITWLSAKADVATASASTGNWASAAADIKTPSATGNDDLTGIYHEQVQIIATGGETGTVGVNLTGLSIATVTGDSAPAIRVGATVLVAVDNKVIAWAKSTGADDIKNFASAAANSSVGDDDGAYPKKFSSTVLLGQAGYTEQTPLTVDVYVYLDGTDDQVYTQNVSANQLISGVTLNFAKAA